MASCHRSGKNSEPESCYHLTLTFSLVANTGSRAPEVQGDDRCCCACYEWCEDLKGKVDTSRNQTDVQRAYENVEGTTQCRTSLRLVLVVRVTFTFCLGSNSRWRSQSDMRCLASKQYRRLFCGYWPLDRRNNADTVGAEEWPSWLYATQQCSQR
jgi:hypothetical protein